MAKKVQTELTDYFHHYPRTVPIITAHSGTRDNAMAAAWHSPISREPPIYGVAISPRRFTLQLILESQEFGINFIPFEAVELVVAVGNTKGKEMDKFAAFHIARDRPVKTSVPILKQAYAAYECRLLDHRPYGDHEWVVGEVLAIHTDPEAFSAQGVLDLARVKPVLYLSRDCFLTADGASLRLLEKKG